MWKRALRWAGRRLHPSPGGCLDVCRDGRIEGWAWHAGQPQRAIQVEVFESGARVATVSAGDFRQDLLAAGIGDGRHAFQFDLPPGVNSREIRVVIAGTDFELPLRAPAAAAGPAYYERFAPLLRDGAWCIDEVSVEASRLHFSGWCLPPNGVPAGEAGFLVNGRPCGELLKGLPRPDLGCLFPYVTGAEQSGFRCSAETLAGDGGEFELAFGAAGGGGAFRRESNQYFTMDDLPLPETERRQRVHGARGESGFRLEGFSAYRKLEQALRRQGRSFDGCPRILDWGCGCGRVTRYFARHSGVQVFGVDIDADNIGWCRRNLPFANFSQVELHPPATPVEREFSLAIGISVFTHLREEAMLEWLQWLRRVLARDGLALVTVHGEFAWARSAHRPLKDYRRWLKRGILDDLPNADLDAVLDGSDRTYYRHTFHTRAYLDCVWSRWFEIVEVIPAYIGNLQDLVVMRPKR